MTIHPYRKQLEAMAEPELAEFSARLNPTLERDAVLGIRVPALRQLAKTILKENAAEAFLRDVPHRYLEENILHGILISSIKDYDACLQELEAFLPYADSWAVTDLIRPKVFRKHTAELEPVLYRWLKAEEPYTVRIAINLFMACYLHEAFEPRQAETIAAVRMDHYYVKMMVAWYMATALVHQRAVILKLLEHNAMDVWTHNKTIQKAIESYRISEEDKAYLRSLRRHE